MPKVFLTIKNSGKCDVMYEQCDACRKQRDSRGRSKSSLKFNSVCEFDVQKEILNLSSKEATRKGDIPAKILKSTINSYLSKL